MKRPIILSALVFAAALFQAASSAAAPSFTGTHWLITPLPNGGGEPLSRRSRVSFMAGDAGYAYFHDNPAKKYKVRWLKDDAQHNVTWWMIGAEGVENRAFRGSWTPPYAGGALMGYSCVVPAGNFNPAFACDHSLPDYNFEQTPAAGK